MPYVTSHKMLADAQRGGYAIGAFNAENMEMVMAIIAAADDVPVGVGRCRKHQKPHLLFLFRYDKIRTNFKGGIKMNQIGDEKNPYTIIFYIRRANGRLFPALRVNCQTRKNLAKVLLQFRRARRAVGISSKALFGGGFPVGSLRWLACHSGHIKDFTRKNGKNRKIKFTAPRIRNILHFVE